jgi:hypothetical protein
LTTRDIVESVAAISLSHFAGSALAQTQQARADRAATLASADGVTNALMHLEPARLKSTAELIKSIYDAAAPVAAGGAAVRAAFGHMLF